METNNSTQLMDLTIEEQMSIQGGSEFSESVFRTIGWFFGGIAGAFQSVHNQQASEIRAGLSPRNA